MKNLKKKMRKKTIEAYACSGCGNPDDCVIACAGDILNLNAKAGNYAQAYIAKA